ncbi:GNAT family N-acetyltransferase [Massilia sp. PAMC28688]|uniref:GNAT family N-acetyltransferase n=1 Tax=Massilia sp. PAMC28688 TaxID=2861283 RepID=UPI001C634921|nr:GNAT family N-acetyltransferase [Massilia sp. PAMC28688]QYF95070.1 GNAT family N-acetyltransferase [Massilia sp. PAMC28688]
MKWTLLPACALEDMSTVWNELHARSDATPLLALDFVQPLLTEFARGDELLARCDMHGRTVAMALVVRTGRGRWSTFQPSQAPVGLWLQERGLDVNTLLACLMRALPGMPLVFGLTQCDPDLLPRPPDGPRLRTMDYIDTARITLAGSFDDYWQARGKNLRSNLKKQRAKLAKDGVPLRMQICRDPADVAQAVADYGRLESAGWKAGGGTAVAADNDQGRYYRAMLERFCARGAGSIYRYWFGEQLAAMDLCVEDAQQIIVLKTTYDETIPKSLSPTLLMREEACRALFEARAFERLEFYGKVMEWHTRWTDEVRTLYHINFYRWPIIASLHARQQARRPD